MKKPHPLKIFLVGRFGNEAEGPNGRHTLFFVRSRTFQQAANIVTEVLSQLNEKNVDPFANFVWEIGLDISGSNQGGVLQGPLYEINRGFLLADDYPNLWTRDGGDQKWRSRRRENLSGKK